MVPQAPQLVRLAMVFVSQPFELSPSQLLIPVLQEMTTQAPEAQAEFAFARLQLRPQAPQLRASPEVVLMQRSPQSVCPEGQLPLWQAPAEQLAVPPVGVRQVCPQRPQLKGSFWVLTQLEPQIVLPLAQAQDPDWQV